MQGTLEEWDKPDKAMSVGAVAGARLAGSRICLHAARVRHFVLWCKGGVHFLKICFFDRDVLVCVQNIHNMSLCETMPGPENENNRLA